MIVYYAALSLDGRIAGPDHDLAFLETLAGGPEGDYERFYETCDSLIMGGGTWEFLVRHGSWMYADKPCWLVSRSHTPGRAPGRRGGRDLRGRPRRPRPGDREPRPHADVADRRRRPRRPAARGRPAGRADPDRRPHPRRRRPGARGRLVPADAVGAGRAERVRRRGRAAPLRAQARLADAQHDVGELGLASLQRAPRISAEHRSRQDLTPDLRASGRQPRRSARDRGSSLRLDVRAPRKRRIARVQTGPDLKRVTTAAASSKAIAARRQLASIASCRCRSSGSTISRYARKAGCTA